MTVTIDLTLEQERRLTEQARAHGKRLDEYLRETIEKMADAPMRSNAVTLALLDTWDAEDETEDAAELAQREAEWEELKKMFD